MGKTICWSCDPDAERLAYVTVHQAVEMYLDDIPPEAWPKELEAIGYKRMEAPNFDPERLIEYVLERWDEELGDPDGDYESPVTDEMREAANTFLAVMKAEYEPWACEPSGEVEKVNVAAWAREHAWIDELAVSVAVEKLETTGDQQ